MTDGTDSAARYLKQLRTSTVAPRGFDVAIGAVSFVAEEQGKQQYDMNLALVHSRVPATPYASLTTTNAIASPSVTHLRKRAGRGVLQTLFVNNKVSNVGSQSGEDNFLCIQQQVGELLEVPRRSVLPVSTGVIGWSLPMQKIANELPVLTKKLGANSFVDFAQAIMTTDRFPKLRSVACGDGVLLGVCKGAGMVEPNLNTMLVFFFTDISFSNRELACALREAVGDSFGAISVDGDQSTSDIITIQSSCLAPKMNRKQFTASLTELARQLALDVVRNGEGVGHLMQVKVSGARSKSEARNLARFLLNSRLVATAIAGNDPNVGRLIARIGQYFGTVRHSKKVDARRIRILMESQSVFENGHFCLTPQMEATLNRQLADKSWDNRAHGYPIRKEAVEIAIDLRRGNGTATVYGGDLTAEYVHINADYRS